MKTATKTLTANPTTIRRIRTLVRHGHHESEISVRLLVGLEPLRRFCAAHQIELTPVVIDAPALAPLKTGADFDRKPRSPSLLSVTLEFGTLDAIQVEAMRRGTTAAKLAAEILAIVAARHERGDNLFAAVLDY